ncbi:MAG: hypothetical protein IJJ19_04120 [Erysipelotrichaceae bacterium]|nr:hypothetical protein [Erysipelotrichaceae bacterium]
MSIYQDEKRTVYSPFYSKAGYVVSADNCRYYVSYIQGYLMALLIFSVAYLITRNLIISLSLAILFIIGNFISFYMNFMKKAATIYPYKKPERDSFAVRQAQALETKNIITIIVCCPLLAATLLLNGHINKFEGLAFYLNIGMSVFALLYGLLHVYILILKKRNH